MDALLAATGVVLLVAMLSDLVATAVAPSLHGGWLTRRGATGTWRLVRHVLGGRSRALQLSGLALVMGLVATWIGTLLVGWTLVFLGLGDLRTSTGAEAGVWDTIYFAGYTLSTMGNGDIVPIGGGSQVLTVVAAISGLLTLTLAITYLVPVLRAAADRRVLASGITAIGTTPAEIARSLWPDRSTGRHDQVVLDLARHVRETTQAHSSYPILHFFRARHRRVALAPNVAALDEALATVVDDDPTAAPVPERLLADAISALLDALTASFVRTRVVEPPPATLPGTDTGRTERRRELAAWCIDDGWQWADVVGDERAPEVPSVPSSP